MAYTTIAKPNQYFNTLLYTGDGSASDRTITGVGFQPDWLWNKSRSNAYNHYIFDVLRGTNMLSSNATLAQEDKSPQFSAFTSDGFTIRNDAGSLAINASGVTFANWCWKANGAGVSNTDGSTTSTVSANQTSGFSVVKWVGVDTTVGHGLNAVPEMIIVKNIDDASHWFVYHKSIGNGKFLTLNETGVEQTSSTIWNATSPTSSVFTVGSGLNNANYIAYVFAPKKGFSKMGLYEGNGNGNGTFVYTGFKPAFVLYKAKGAVQSWNIQDNKRLGYNPNNAFLFPNLAQAESDITRIDLLSNGFKLKTSDAGQNGSGQGYIYMAFAENPIVTTDGLPATAR